MIALWLILLAAGIGLSAFFSGSETGFYRASRTRLVLDAMEGQSTSRQLLFFFNRPTLFVATALVGNNVANYLVSLAIVLLTKSLVGAGVFVEMGASIVFAPVVFVYGELLPKNLFYQAPNMLLRRVSLAFRGFAVLLAPVSAILWLMSRLLELLFGQSPTGIRLALAKKELGDVMHEGHAAGILQPTQLELSQNFFDVATLPVTRWMIPLARLALVDPDLKPRQIRDLAGQGNQNRILVADRKTGLPAGTVSLVEWLIQPAGVSLTAMMQPLMEVRSDTPHGEVILMMQTNRTELAGVVDPTGRLVGVVSREALLEPVLGHSLGDLLGGGDQWAG